jgi:hypothetical protein
LVNVLPKHDERIILVFNPRIVKCLQLHSILLSIFNIMFEILLGFRSFPSRLVTVIRCLLGMSLAVMFQGGNVKASTIFA